MNIESMPNVGQMLNSARELDTERHSIDVLGYHHAAVHVADACLDLASRNRQEASIFCQELNIGLNRA